jgi:flagellar biosynthetic protein FliQ
VTPDTIATLSQQALLVAVQLTAPILLSALAIGLLIAVFQAATQINEMTLAFVPKLVIIGVVLVVAGPWMLGVLVDYTRDLIKSIPGLIG